MVDNDIVTEVNKDFEFYQQDDRGDGGLLGNVEDDEWKIE
jgi:hypothetical protein